MTWMGVSSYKVSNIDFDFFNEFSKRFITSLGEAPRVTVENVDDCVVTNTIGDEGWSSSNYICADGTQKTAINHRLSDKPYTVQALRTVDYGRAWGSRLIDEVDYAFNLFDGGVLLVNLKRARDYDNTLYGKHSDSQQIGLIEILKGEIETVVGHQIGVHIEGGD